mmetsp:Transcript_3882/g.13005  ORF Transcript_3882/g.13005 Transcript_3882/m.13005 type:complete len:242 (-) Transcript_3882:398-1123(-)
MPRRLLRRGGDRGRLLPRRGAQGGHAPARALCRLPAIPARAAPALLRGGGLDAQEAGRPGAHARAALLGAPPGHGPPAGGAGAAPGPRGRLGGGGRRGRRGRAGRDHCVRPRRDGLLRERLQARGGGHQQRGHRGFHGVGLRPHGGPGLQRSAAPAGRRARARHRPRGRPGPGGGGHAGEYGLHPGPGLRGPGADRRQRGARRGLALLPRGRPGRGHRRGQGRPGRLCGPRGAGGRGGWRR